MIASRPRLHALTGLRFFAALQVVLFHFQFALRELGVSVPPWIGSWAGAGYTGVSFFFVLSGFVLAYGVGGPGSGEVVVDRRAFWAARWARIYPLYLLSLLIALPIFAWTQLGARWSEAAGALGGGLLLCALLAQAWFPHTAMLINPPGWSLSVEGFFYAAFPWVLRPLTRLRARGLVLTAAVSWLLSVGPALLYLWLSPDGPGSSSFGPETASVIAPWLAALKFNPLLRLPEFLLGMALARLFVLRGAWSARVASAVGLGAVAVIVTVLCFSRAIPYPVLHNGLLAPAYGALIFALASGEGALARTLSRAWLVRLGEASYALYLLHVPLFLWMKTLGAGLSQASPLLFVGGALGGCIAVSLGVHRWFEVPVRRLLRERVLAPRLPGADARAKRGAWPGSF